MNFFYHQFKYIPETIREIINYSNVMKNRPKTRISIDKLIKNFEKDQLDGMHQN